MKSFLLLSPEKNEHLEFVHMLRNFNPGPFGSPSPPTHFGPRISELFLYLYSYHRPLIQLPVLVTGVSLAPCTQWERHLLKRLLLPHCFRPRKHAVLPTNVFIPSPSLPKRISLHCPFSCNTFLVNRRHVSGWPPPWPPHHTPSDLDVPGYALLWPGVRSTPNLSLPGSNPAPAHGPRPPLLHLSPFAFTAHTIGE